MELLNVPAIYHKFKQDWRKWIEPIIVYGQWYSEDYFNETLEKLSKATGAVRHLGTIFMVIPPPPQFSPK